MMYFLFAQSLNAALKCLPLFFFPSSHATISSGWAIMLNGRGSTMKRLMWGRFSALGPNLYIAHDTMCSHSPTISGSFHAWGVHFSGCQNPKGKCNWQARDNFMMYFCHFRLEFNLLCWSVKSPQEWKNLCSFHNWDSYSQRISFCWKCVSGFDLLKHHFPPGLLGCRGPGGFWVLLQLNFLGFSCITRENN